MGTMLTVVYPCQRKNPDAVLAPPCPFGETKTISIVTRLLRYVHGVLGQLLGWRLSVWEGSGKYEPTREV